MTRRFVSTCALAGWLTVSGSGQRAPGIESTDGADWPQWRGPDRSGLSMATGLLDTWPASGPPLLWSASNLGGGYGSIAVSGDRIFVQGRRGGDSVASSLDRADGRMIWTKVLGPGGTNDRGSGPRSTPTVDGDRLYVLTETGDLVCLRRGDGTVVWQRNILRDFRARNLNWLVSESPLVDGRHVIVTPGGRNAGMVALDKLSGETVWTTRELSDEAGYASAIAADVDGVRTVMTLTSAGGVGVRVSDGKLLWRFRRVANRTANVATPIFHDNQVFYTSSYGTGGVLLGLEARDDGIEAREIYFTRDMQNHHGGVLLVDGYLYGFHNSVLTCLEFATGRRMWRDRSIGKGSLTYADGHLFVLSENNVVGLVEATPTGYREKGRFRIADAGLPSWAHPVVAGGRLYIRNQGTLAAYHVQAP